MAHKSCHKGAVLQKSGVTPRTFAYPCYSISIMRLLWLLGALILSAGLTVLHVTALSEALYWQYVWLDVPVHFLGGLTLAMLLVAFLKKFHPLVFIASMAAVIVGWELFELSIQTARESNFLFDTALDVLMGSLGAVVAYILARYTLWRSA